MTRIMKTRNILFFVLCSFYPFYKFVIITSWWSFFCGVILSLSFSAFDKLLGDIGKIGKGILQILHSLKDDEL